MYKLIAIWAMLILLSACGGSSSSTTTTSAASNDTIPNSFTLVDQIGVLTSMTATSLPITIDGINADTTISVTGGEYSIAEATNLPVETQNFTSEEGKVGNITAFESQWNRNWDWRRAVPDPRCRRSLARCRAAYRTPG